MAWQGIPFPIRSEDAFYYADVVLNKIPKIIVELPDKGWSLEGLATALLAGGIPALVAWLAMRANNKTMKLQLEQQERITRMTLTAELITANRRKLVDELRDSSSKFLAYAQTAINVSNNLMNEEKKSIPDQDKLNALMQSKLDCFEKIATERWRIKLLIDANNPHYVSIVQTMTEIVSKLNNSGLYPSGYTTSDFNKHYDDLQNSVAQVIKSEQNEISLLN